MASGIQIDTVINVSVGIAVLFLLFSNWIFRLRQTTHALQLSQARLQSILDASPIPHVVNINQQKITYVNQAFIDTFGYTLQDIPTVDIWRPKAYPDPEYRSWVAKIWQQRFSLLKTNAQKFEPIELNVQCKNGDIRHVLASESAITEPGDDTHVVIFYDITDDSC